MSNIPNFACRNVSGLPFHDVMLLENLPKSASLPVATSQEAKRRIRSGEWDFDYIFYTESDQVFVCISSSIGNNNAISARGYTTLNSMVHFFAQLFYIIFYFLSP